MRYAFAFLILPLSLLAFTPHPVTPNPVVGFQQVPFEDDVFKISREILVWYPVDPTTAGVPSKSPWDDFYVAEGAPVYSTNKKKPVVIISHGYTGNPHQLSWLVRELVHNDIIVLGIQHLDLIDGKPHLNLWARPRDISLVINEFTKSQLSRYASLGQLGLAGFSLGGTTAIWIEGGRSTKLDHIIPGPEYASPDDFAKADEALPSLRKEMMQKDWSDPRVKAAFIMAPSWSWIFDEESLKKVSIPTYLIAAAADQVVVTKNNAGFYAKFIPNAIYQEIPGANNHYIFMTALNDVQRKAADPNNKLPAAVFADGTSIDRAWIQEETAEEAVNFFLSVFKTD